MVIRDWAAPVAVALLAIFGWMPVCWAIGRLMGWC